MRDAGKIRVVRLIVPEFKVVECELVEVSSLLRSDVSSWYSVRCGDWMCVWIEHVYEPL